MNVGTLWALLQLKDEMSAQLGGIKQNLTSFGQTARTAAGIAAGAFAAIDLNKVREDTKRLVSEFADLSAKTGASAEALQRIGFAARQGGAPLSAVGAAFREMSKSLSGGDKPANKLLEELGLNLEALKNSKPEESFYLLADAVRAIEDPIERGKAATILFGRAGTSLLPAIRDGFREVGAQATVMSDATVAAGDKTFDKLDALEQKFGVMKARALIPVLELFTSLPDEVQTAAAGIVAFLPSVESIGLAVLAAGGPKAAMVALMGSITSVGTTLGGLGVTMGGWIAGAGAALVTFCTTTLPAAFAAVITFLGPQGLIALGILALAAIWYKWGDDITAIVKRIWSAVSEYLGGKLNAIWDGVKTKIDAVKGYFKDLYTAVVGGSYIPDMVDGIGKSIARLDDVFVSPSRAATAAVQEAFRVAGQIAVKAITDILPGVKTVFDGVREQTNVLRTDGSSLMHGVGVGFKDSLLAGLGGGLGQAISSLVTAGVGALANKLRGGEEAMIVNPARDAFFAMFGGYQGLATVLTGKSDGNIADELIKVLYNADTKAAFEAAKEAIIAVLSGSIPGVGAQGSPAGQAMDALAGSTGLAETATVSLTAKVQELGAALLALPREIGIAITGSASGFGGSLPSFAGGTNGLRDFGAGTLAILHNKEEVRTENQARADTATRDEIAGLRADMRSWMQIAPLAMRDARILGA